MSLRKVAGLLVAFGLMAGLIGGGVGAQFTDQVTAVENINVAPFGCGITTATTGALFGGIDALGYAHTVSYTAPTILSSAPGSAPFSFTVKNTGGIPAVLTITESPTLSPPWSYIPLAPASPVNLAPGASQAFATGVQWLELSTAGTTGTVTWTVNCGEQAAAGVGFPVGYYAVNNGGTQFAAGTWVRSTSPIASTAVVSGGNATQSISGGDVNLAISGNTGYADNGFYVPLGTLASLATSGYTVTGTGSDFGTNLYLDVNNNGEFFGWTANSLSSITPDAFGLGPTSVAGTLTVTGSSNFLYVCATSPTTLNQLVGGACAGISGATQVAVWVGITSTGAALSTTITSAP
jgi:hypothetical protein